MQTAETVSKCMRIFAPICLILHCLIEFIYYQITNLKRFLWSSSQSLSVFICYHLQTWPAHYLYLSPVHKLKRMKPSPNSDCERILLFISFSICFPFCNHLVNLGSCKLTGISFHNFKNQIF